MASIHIDVDPAPVVSCWRWRFPAWHSACSGGVTIIPGGVKSKANIAAGGGTLCANFTNSICLIIDIARGHQLINLIPRGVLASVLSYTGWWMCEPAVWKLLPRHNNFWMPAARTFSAKSTVSYPGFRLTYSVTEGGWVETGAGLSGGVAESFAVSRRILSLRK